MSGPKLEKKRLISYLGQEPPRFVADDVIAAMLYYVAEDFNKKFFSGDPKEIHTPLAELKRKGFSLLQKFPFSESDIFPFSRILEDVLTRLQISRIIGMENPDFERFEIKSTANKYVKEEIIPKFEEKEQKEIKEIAEYFAEYCGSK